MVSISNHHISENAVTALVQQEGAPMWWLTGVYGPQGSADKIAFLHELADIRDLHAGPWVVAGDFNLIVNAEDKNNENINRQMLARFRALLNRLELKELYLNGRRYTWSNERQNPTMEKIDHVFAMNTWEDGYPANLLIALGTSISDRCPLLLDLDAEF
uniref:Endonuclease/exonuclease/phosphatase domain-containing protein n=1 Tax=Triticum urartu TaxID=4572 RepID=A0A8R7TFI0_TRIUA